jgi:hypothetical protein
VLVVLAGLGVTLVAFALSVFVFDAAEDVSTALAPITGVIGTVVGAYFGVQVGASGKEDAEAARTNAENEAKKLAAVAPAAAAAYVLGIGPLPPEPGPPREPGGGSPAEPDPGPRPGSPPPAAPGSEPTERGEPPASSTPVARSARRPANPEIAERIERALERLRERYREKVEHVGDPLEVEARAESGVQAQLRWFEQRSKDDTELAERLERSADRMEAREGPNDVHNEEDPEISEDPEEP